MERAEGAPLRMTGAERAALSMKRAEGAPLRMGKSGSKKRNLFLFKVTKLSKLSINKTKSSFLVVNLFFFVVFDV